MDKSQHDVKKTAEMSINQSNINECIPRLKKNRRLELRWGQQYYIALKDAVFSIKNNCHMSPEMPTSLQTNNQTPQKNFICKPCGDSFHFQSSFDDHNSRYSWILGYWCNHCFQIQCDHSVDVDSLCLTCHNMTKSKRAYLKTKGLRKGQKVGATLLFHNQCQFFEHLKQHNVTVVDMGDIMLMPLPLNIQYDEYSQIDHVCKALMEYMFIKRIHIMDWLRINNINCKWWKPENYDNNAVGELLRNYAGSNDTTLTNSKHQLVSKTCIMMNDCMGGLESSEDDDDPCSTEIPFVNDESTKNTSTNQKNMDAEKINIPTSTSNKPSAILASVSEMNDLSKERNIKISTSTSSHPSNSVNNKKIIIISQTSKVNGDDDTAINNGIQIAGKAENTRTTSVMTSPLSSVSSNLTDMKKISGIANNSISYLKTSDRRVVLGPGAKIVFRQLQKPATSILKVDLDKNSTALATPKFNIVKNRLKILPTKVVTSNVEQTKDVVVIVDGVESLKSDDVAGTAIDSVKLAPTNNTEVVPVLGTEPVEKHPILLLRKIGDEPKKLRPKRIAPKEDKIDVNDNDSMIAKYRESMKKSLQQYSTKKIQEIIGNIREVSKKYQVTKKCVDVKNVTARNLTAIKKFEKYLDKTCNGHTDGKFANNIDVDCKYEFHDWESQHYRTMIKPECNKCHRKLKPMDYIIGISKPATNELKFCECYNCICHLCDSKLGNQKRYQAHIRFHKKESPYVCPECDETFNSMFHLETHIWTKCFHIMTQQFFSCLICEIDGLITMEDVTRHYAHVHARNVVFCNECQRLFDSYSDHQVHYQKEHATVDSLTADPVHFLICELSRCLVRPENFHTHAQTHAEIAAVTYYTCPFCIFFVKDIAKNRQTIRNHVLGKHANQLREVITPQTTRFLTSGYKSTSLHPQRRYIPIAPAANVVVPKIVSSCSIASETFGLTSCSVEKPQTQNNSDVSEIVDVNSDEVDGSSQIQCIQNSIVTPKILNVIPINSNESGLKKEETTKPELMPTSGDVQNTNIEVEIGGSEIITLPNPCAVDSHNSIVEINCDTIKKSEVKRGDTDTVQINEIEKSFETQTEVQHEATNIPSVKIEDVNPLTLPIIPQHPLINKINDTSDDVTSTIPVTETKAQEEGIQESSLNNTAEIHELPLSPLEHLSTVVEKEKVPNKIMSNIQLLIKQKRRRRRPWRIALNGPNDFTDRPINYKCHLCSERISTSWSIVNSHFNAKHSRDYKLAVIAPMLTRLSPSVMKIEQKDDRRKRKLDSSLTTVKKKRRWAHKKFSDRSTSPSLGICIRQESLQDTEGNFRCKKCEYLFKDVNTLREHVASNHRIRGHFLICLECGENFVVAPSLQMHLKAFHGITDPITYMAQNTAYAPDMTDELEAQERIIESNQCYVCRAVFEDKAAVDKHMRVHGMAFLNRKRIEARNALRSPEKKMEITSSTSNVNKAEQKIEKRSSNTNNNNQHVLPESDSADVSILTRISRLLS